MFSAGVITPPLFSTELFGTSILDILADMTSHFGTMMGMRECLSLTARISASSLTSSNFEDTLAFMLIFCSNHL